MKIARFSAFVALPAAVLMIHPLGCSIFHGCEDDATCVEVPEGWTGYHYVREQAGPGATAKPCDDGSAAEAYYVEPQDPQSGIGQTCRTCECSKDGAKAACKLPKIECWNGSGCGNDKGTKLKTNVVVDECTYSSSTQADDEDGSIIPPGKLAETTYCRVEHAPVAPKSEPHEIEVTPLPTYGGRIDVCGVPTREEPGGHPSQVKICISTEGHESSCPKGWEDKRLTYRRFVDGRTCLPCECASKCQWSGYAVYDDDFNQCSDGEPQIAIGEDGACTEITALWLNSYYAVKTSNPTWDLTSTGGTISGTVTLDGPVTFCCK